MKADTKQTGNPTMLQNIKEAKQIEQLIDSKSDAVTLGGPTNSPSLNINVAYTENIDLWGDCKTPNSTPPSTSPIYQSSPPHHTTTNKRKRKLEDAVTLLVEHVTKTPITSQETTTLTQLIQQMQTQQQLMMTSIQQLQAQLFQQQEKS